MRKTNVYFKYALSFVKKQKEIAKADALARDLFDKDVESFWKTVYKMNSNNTVQANVIDGITEQHNIADYWKQHFQRILNANDCDTAMKADIMRTLKRFQHTPDMVILTSSVSQIIANAECCKSAGHADGICSENLKFSNVKIHALLALCFSLCLSHSYLPADLV